MINTFRTRFLFNEDDGAGGSAPEILEQEAPQEQVQQPQGLTREDMAEFAQSITQGISQAVAPPQVEEEEEIPANALYDVDALRNLIRAESSKAVQQAQAQWSQQMQTIAPIVANQQAAAIASGLPPAATEYVTQQLSQYAPAQIAAISADPNMREMLRLAAQGYAINKAGVPIPGMTPTPGTVTESVDQSEVSRLMTSMGLDKATATQIVKEAMKA